MLYLYHFNHFFSSFFSSFSISAHLLSVGYISCLLLFSSISHFLLLLSSLSQHHYSTSLLSFPLSFYTSSPLSIPCSPPLLFQSASSQKKKLLSRLFSPNSEQSFVIDPDNTMAMIMKVGVLFVTHTHTHTHTVRLFPQLKMMAATGKWLNFTVWMV